MTQGSQHLASIFEERAENLDEDELNRWTSETSRDIALLKKLKGPGLKLLSGPRGSGKSTLLRKAYFSLLEDKDVLPAYVNFSKSLALEPLFHKKANALQIFRQWVMFKIIIGISTGLRESKTGIPQSLKMLRREGLSFIHDLETSLSVELPNHLVSPSELVILIEQWLAVLGKSRCVLLLDDAAHAFSPEQQREFFEVFGALRSRRISAKAAVYPGTTSYSPIFHVGHEAEKLEAWHSPDDETYLQTMREVAKNRLPESMYKLFEDRPELIDYLALASFGIPRGFLNMLSFVLGIEDGNNIAKPTRHRAEQAVSIHADSVRSIFSSLKGKLPRYKRFVDVGIELDTSLARTLRTYNESKIAGRNKAATVGIAEPLSNEIGRILTMMEYSGLIRSQGSISRGEKGVFSRYTLHYAVVLSENCLALGKSYALKAAIESLSSSSSHAFTRSKATTLLDPNYQARCTIDLAPCVKCGAPRVSNDAKFCMNCGAELTNSSIYEDLVKAPIASLPLTEKKIDGLLEYTSIRSVQDILLDDEFDEISKVPYVGPVWKAKIQNAAQEYVSV